MPSPPFPASQRWCGSFPAVARSNDYLRHPPPKQKKSNNNRWPPPEKKKSNNNRLPSPPFPPSQRWCGVFLAVARSNDYLPPPPKKKKVIISTQSIPNFVDRVGSVTIAGHWLTCPRSCWMLYPSMSQIPLFPISQVWLEFQCLLPMCTYRGFVTSLLGCIMLYPLQISQFAYLSRPVAKLSSSKITLVPLVLVESHFRSLTFSSNQAPFSVGVMRSCGLQTGGTEPMFFCTQSSFYPHFLSVVYSRHCRLFWTLVYEDKPILDLFMIVYQTLLIVFWFVILYQGV